MLFAGPGGSPGSTVPGRPGTPGSAGQPGISRDTITWLIVA
jgi:hypothetical protein